MTKTPTTQMNFEDIGGTFSPDDWMEELWIEVENGRACRSKRVNVLARRLGGRAVDRSRERQGLQKL